VASAQEKAALTYNAASDYFDHPALGFWDRVGRRTVERLALPAGAAVLDVCCGTGASALQAAAVVGPSGSVLGVDLAEGLVTRARAKAAAAGLGNAHFRVGDMLNLDLADGSFDAVVCVFGIFFVPDVAAGVRALWRLVRPGGQLAVTTWGPRIFEPAMTAFWAAVGTERPDLVEAYQPWDRITAPGRLADYLQAGGVEGVTIEEEAGRQALGSPEDWWAIVLGTGYRATVEQLGPDAAARVKRICLDRIAREDIRAVETNVILALAPR
jgi:ubiquinone/menaquinone biosynthesis C-methylase UbiE